MRCVLGLVLAACAALAVCTLGSGAGGTALVQLLPQAQIAAAEQLFSSAATSDKRIEQKVGQSIKKEDRRAVLAQKKLMRDQQRLKAVIARIKATRNGAGPRDLHGPLKLISAQYSVDLRNGYTQQLNGECTAERKDMAIQTHTNQSNAKTF